MITISNEFKNAIERTDREIKGYVEVIYNNIEVNPTITWNETPLTVGSTTLNEVIDTPRIAKNYASLEQDYFLLDGGFVLPNINNMSDAGYISQNIASECETIDTGIPFVSIDVRQTLSGITIYTSNNIIVNGKLEINGIAYNIENNTENIINITLNEETYVSSIDLYINQMLRSDWRVRISHIDFGITKVYTGEELISFKTIEQIDRFNDTIPENELELTIGDIEGKFDFKNPNNITKYLTNDVLIKPYVGVLTEDSGIEYCLKGTYWLQEYKYNGTEVTFKAKDIYGKLQDKDFNKSYTVIDGRKYHQELTISEYIEFKANAWGVNINDLHLNSFEINNKVNDTYSKIDTKLNNLLKMAIVCGGTFNSDRYGNIVYKSLYNENNTNTTNKIILLDNMKEYSNIKINEPIKTFGVNETIINFKDVGTLEQFYRNSFNSNEDVTLYIDAEDWKTMEVPSLTNATLLTSSWSVDPTLPEGEQGYYGTIDDTYAFMKIRCRGNVSITIRAYSNSTSTNTYSKEVEKVGKDISVNDDYIATNGYSNSKIISDNIINFNINNRPKHSISFEYNGDPTIECGDVIRVQDKYSEEPNRMIITKIESTFNGGYEESIEGDIIE